MGYLTETYDRMFRSGRKRQEMEERTARKDKITEGLVVQVINKSSGEMEDEVRGDKQMYQRKLTEYGRDQYVVQLVDEKHNRILQTNQPGGARPDTAQSAGVGDVVEAMSDSQRAHANLPSSYQVTKAYVLSDLKPGDEVEARGVARTLDLTDMGATRALNDLVSEGLLVMNGKWYSLRTVPVESTQINEVAYPPDIDAVRAIIRNRRAEKFQWPQGGSMVVDVDTAKLLVALYDDHGPTGKDELDRMMSSGPSEFRDVLRRAYDFGAEWNPAQHESIEGSQKLNFKQISRGGQIDLTLMPPEQSSIFEYVIQDPKTKRFWTGAAWMAEYEFAVHYTHPTYAEEDLAYLLRQWGIQGEVILVMEEPPVVPTLMQEAIHMKYGDMLDRKDIPEEAIEDMSGPGQKDRVVAMWRKKLNFTVDPEGARRYLNTTGIDGVDEMDDDTLADYVLWMAAGDMAEEDRDWFYLGEQKIEEAVNTLVFDSKREADHAWDILTDIEGLSVMQDEFHGPAGAGYILTVTGDRYYEKDLINILDRRGGPIPRVPKTGRGQSNPYPESVTEAIDQIAADELRLYIDNDGDLYRQQKMPIIKNIKRKMKRGVYDHNKAPKLWMYLVDNGAKKYAKDFSVGTDWNDMFPKPLRMAVAQEMADYYKRAIEGGEYGPLDEAHVTEARTVNMYAMYIGDGYLAGATTDHNGDDPYYWPPEMREGDDWEIAELNRVPQDLAEQLEVQGTSDQYFSDGYDAANAAAPYAGDTIESARDYIESVNPNTREAQDALNEQGRLVDTIRAGDRVTIVTPQGQKRTGRATMKGPAGWVLNMGGRHGTPAIASDDNVIKVKKGKAPKHSLAMRRLVGESLDEATPEAYRKARRDNPVWVWFKPGDAGYYTEDDLARTFGILLGKQGFGPEAVDAAKWEDTFFTGAPMVTSFGQTAVKLQVGNFNERLQIDVPEHGVFGGVQAPDRRDRQRFLDKIRANMNGIGESIEERAGQAYNVFTTPLDKARMYSADEFNRAGMSLEETIPNFDPNYMEMQSKKRYVKDIPRVLMPVIEPRDIKVFEASLQQGHIDIFKPEAMTHLQSKFPDHFVSRDEAAEWLTLGVKDGDPNDDVLRASITRVEASRLKPLQSEIWLTNIIPNIIKFGVAQQGSPVTEATLIVSEDNYIIDGHHRTAQAWLGDPSLKMKALLVPLPIDDLLEVARSYGAALGNQPKESVEPLDEYGSAGPGNPPYPSDDRPSAALRGYGHGWRKERAAYLESHPVCEVDGCDCASHSVHHLRALKDGGGQGHGNFYATCAGHHNSIEKNATWESDVYYVDDDLNTERYMEDDLEVAPYMHNRYKVSVTFEETTWEKDDPEDYVDHRGFDFREEVMSFTEIIDEMEERGMFELSASPIMESKDIPPGLWVSTESELLASNVSRRESIHIDGLDGKPVPQGEMWAIIKAAGLVR
jgi:hypothetical protein